MCGQNLENDDRPIQWYDTSGNPQGSAGATNKLFNRITLDTGDGIYVGGNGASSSIYIEKYTPSSGTNPVWNKSFSSGIQFGGFSIDLDFGKESGDLMVVGWFQGTVDFNSPGSYSSTLTSSGGGSYNNVYVARYSAASGNCDWVKTNVTYNPGQADPIAVACSNQHVHVVGIVVSTTMNASFCGNAANIVADNAANAYLAKYTQRLFAPASILGASYTLPGETEEYSVSTPTTPGAKSYQWYVPSGWNITYTSSDQSYIFAGVGNSGGNVAARAVYDCGNSGLATLNVEVGGGFGLRSIYPNPASDNLTVDVEPSKNEVSITLTSESGKPLKQGKLKSKEEKLTLPVADLARGRYYLVLKRGDKSLGKQVVIEH